MDTFDADDVARLRVALGRIARRLDRQSRHQRIRRPAGAPTPGDRTPDAPNPGCQNPGVENPGGENPGVENPGGDALTPTQASVLATVAREGPLRISELAEIEGVNPTMLSRIVGKLEDGGLLSRRPDPADGRAARVEVTPAGDDLHRRQRAERTALLTARLARMPDAAALLAALPALESLADELAES